jgi:hypothetical protein
MKEDDRIHRLKQIHPDRPLRQVAHVMSAAMHTPKRATVVLRAGELAPSTRPALQVRVAISGVQRRA